MAELESDPIEGKSLGELVALASGDVSSLVKSEIELAKLELRDDAKRVGVGAAMFAVAAFLACLILVLLSIAAAYGLVALGLSHWAAFLVVAGVYLLLCAALLGYGYLRLRRMSGIGRTKATVRADLAMLRRSDGTGEATGRTGRAAGEAQR